MSRAIVRIGRLKEAFESCRPSSAPGSSTLKLEEINEGFDKLNEGKAIRQVVLL
jgi:hypothetical protein